MPVEEYDLSARRIKGSHQEAIMFGDRRMIQEEECVPDNATLAFNLQTIHTKTREGVAVSDKAETKSKGVDIMYSGRGMPFRVVLSSLCGGERREVVYRTFFIQQRICEAASHQVILICHNVSNSFNLE
ncbi:hypothetical protein ACN47E_005111 [Coniothyrium glycines]